MFLFATVALLQVGAFEGDSSVWLGLIGGGLLILFFGISFLVKQYKRCPSNRILVIYGRVAGAQAAQCLHGGGKFIIPLLQDYAFLPLEPLVIDIPPGRSAVAQQHPGERSLDVHGGHFHRPGAHELSSGKTTAPG